MFRSRRCPRTTTSRCSPRSALLALEQLESRLAPTASGNAWPSPQLITISFVPDGTSVSTNGTTFVSSNLFSIFNAKYGSAAAWENVVLKAAQSWAQQTNINFSVVSDNGVSLGSGPDQQGDPNMGDIRIGGFNFNNSNLGVAYMPAPANNSSLAGDLMFNTGQPFGTTYDLWTVAAHEMGHAIGLSHSGSPPAVMYAGYNGKKTALASDDITVVRSIYSGGNARSADSYDAGSGNNTFANASNITTQIDGSLTALLTGLDITTTSDLDYYTFTTPSTSASSMSVTVQSSGLSQLSPTLTVYAADQQTVLGSANGSGHYGTTLTVTASIQPSTQYYVKVAGADTSAFSTGAYALTLNVGTGTSPTVPLPNTTLADGYPTVIGGGQPEADGDPANIDSYPNHPEVAAQMAAPAAMASVTAVSVAAVGSAPNAVTVAALVAPGRPQLLPSPGGVETIGTPAFAPAGGTVVASPTSPFRTAVSGGSGAVDDGSVPFLPGEFPTQRAEPLPSPRPAEPDAPPAGNGGAESSLPPLDGVFADLPPLANEEAGSDADQADAALAGPMLGQAALLAVLFSGRQAVERDERTRRQALRLPA